MIACVLIAVAVLVLVACGLLAFASKRAYGIATLSSLLALLLVAAAALLSGGRRICWSLGSGLFELGFLTDWLSLLIGLMISINGLMTILFSRDYISPRNREHPVKPEEAPRYYGWLLLFEAAALGFVFSSSLLSMIISFEVTSLCSYALISYYDTEEARKAGLQAFIITHIAAIGLYAATGLTYISTQSVELSAVRGADDFTKTVVLLLLLLSAMGKSAQFPLHRWLPDAMVAPTPVSAYIHAAAMVKLGAYMMLRALVEAGYTAVAAYACLAVGVISMIYGCLMYFPQVDLKRLLAYSTITQLSYIFAGIGLGALGSSIALQGAALHTFFHGFAKELFFLVSGALSYAAGTRMLDRISGLRKAGPAAVGFTAAALAIVGVPPFNIFWSKLMIILGGYTLGTVVGIAVATLMLCESVVCFAWFLRIFSRCVGGEPSEAVKGMQPLPAVMTAVLYMLVALVVLSPMIALPLVAQAGAQP